MNSILSFGPHVAARPAALFATVFLLASCAHEPADGVRAYERGDHEAAFKIFRELAPGHTGAMVGLAMMYESGDGTPANPVEALRWYRAAAEHGYDAAQYLLGTKFFEGHLVAQDDCEAARWFR